MKTLHLRKTLSILLVAAMAVSALCLTGCSGQPESTDTTAQPAATTEAATTEAAAATEVGEGSTSFAFQVTFADGSQQDYTVKTDSTVVGEALQDAEGLRTMRNLAQNMAWMLNCIESGKAAGIMPPKAERGDMTNFIR